MKQLAYRKQQQGIKGHPLKIGKLPPQKPRHREEAYRVADKGVFLWPKGAQRRPAQDQQQYKEKGGNADPKVKNRYTSRYVLCAFS